MPRPKLLKLYEIGIVVLAQISVGWMVARVLCFFGVDSLGVSIHLYRCSVESVDFIAGLVSEIKLQGRD